MGTTLEIASAVLDAIVAEAAGSPVEICGLLFGDDARIVERRRCRNVAAEPAVAFEIDPAALLAAHRAMRRGGLRLVGCYHSHPSGTPEPSARDAAAAAPDGWFWLIATTRAVGAWRAVERGQQHGRFDPVAIERV
ncbi:Mov34/MPN/PAD-1 family protein [uncultured Sphingomonas sp.]|uniref:Mov34/MPN/PAD-1 family protein n=1 Tax=uncultured Sphingomonas sp. TaxID=158754 RepID=UPI0035CA3703